MSFDCYYPYKYGRYDLIKKLALSLVIFTSFLSLNSCANKNAEEDVIDLDEDADVSSKDREESQEESILFTEYFKGLDKLSDCSMESEQKDEILYLRGKNLSLADDYFSLVKYINYSYNQKEDIISAAIFLDKESYIKESKIDQDSIIIFEYDFASDEVNEYQAYDMAGEKIELPQLKKSELKEISNDFKDFIIKIAS